MQRMGSSTAHPSRHKMPDVARQDRQAVALCRAAMIDVAGVPGMALPARHHGPTRRRRSGRDCKGGVRPGQRVPSSRRKGGQCGLTSGIGVQFVKRRTGSAPTSPRSLERAVSATGTCVMDGGHTHTHHGRDGRIERGGRRGRVSSAAPRVVTENLGTLGQECAVRSQIVRWPRRRGTSGEPGTRRTRPDLARARSGAVISERSEQRFDARQTPRAIPEINRAEGKCIGIGSVPSEQVRATIVDARVKCQSFVQKGFFVRD